MEGGKFKGHSQPTPPASLFSVGGSWASGDLQMWTRTRLAKVAHSEELTPTRTRACPPPPGSAPFQRQKQSWVLRLELMHHRGCNSGLTPVVLYSMYRILWGKSHFRTKQNNKHWAS